MASVGEHLLAELESGDGDITLILGVDQERFKYHSFILRRAEYFKSGLSGGFAEQQSKEFVLSDVLPKHMKPLLHALYCDKLPGYASEVGNTYGSQDLWTMLILSRRFLFPTNVMAQVGATFTKKLAASKSIPAIELFEMMQLCVEMAFPTNVSNSLFKTFETSLKSDKTVTADVCLDLLSKSAAGSTPLRVSSAVLETFKGKLSWGKNVLIMMAKALGKDASTAKQACLEAMGAKLADVKKELHGLEVRKPMFDSQTMNEVKMAMVDKVRSLLAHEPVSVPNAIPIAVTATNLFAHERDVFATAFDKYRAQVADREALLMALLEVKVGAARGAGGNEPKRRRSE